MTTTQTTTRHESAPCLPVEIHTYSDGFVLCTYAGYRDIAYMSDDAAAAAHEVDAASWDEIARVCHSEAWLGAPGQVWEAQMGDQGVAEFLENGGDPFVYVDEADFTHEYPDDVRFAIAEKLQAYIDANTHQG